MYNKFDQRVIEVEESDFEVNFILSTERRVIREKLNAFVCLFVSDQKNIFYKLVKISILTPNGGLIVDKLDHPGSKNHFL